MELKKESVLISLGTNLGDLRKNLLQSIQLLKSEIQELEVVKLSPVYRTKAWGKTTQPDFLNMAIEVSCVLPAQELMQKLLEVETKMGRTRNEKWGPRIIDLDILFYGNQIIKTENLVVPHAEIQNRKFVLIPLQKIIPNFIHPVLNKNISKLLDECKDESSVIAEGNLI